MTALREIPAEEAVEGRPGLERDHLPCEECGLLPLYFEDEYGQVVRVDGCFGGLLEAVTSACCGHGGRKPAYLRVTVGHSHVDVCGGRVIDYADYVAGDGRDAATPPS